MVVLVGLAYGARVVGVGALEREHPRAAAALARHWVWLPILGLLALVTWALGPIGLLLGTLAVGVVASRPDVFGLPPR